MKNNTIIRLPLADLLPMEKVMSSIRIDRGSALFDEVAGLFAEAYRIGTPCGLYRESYVEDAQSEGVVIDGVLFQGELIAEKLAGVHRVFPFVASCGTELSDWAGSVEDALLGYYANILNQMAVGAMALHVHQSVKEESGIEKLAALNPGSLPKWPVTEQIPLFELLHSVTDDIGVRLTPSCLMVPVKSVSGILFATSAEWFNCMRCKRKDCPGRRANYSEE